MNKYYGDMAEFANNVSENELAYYDYIEDITDKIYMIMEEKEVSKAELAKKLGKSRSWVTQALAGDNNFTTKTLVDILLALNCRIETHFVEKDSWSWKNKVIDNNKAWSSQRFAGYARMMKEGAAPISQPQKKVLKFNFPQAA